MRGVGGVRKSIHQSWLAKGLVRVTMSRFKGSSGRDSLGRSQHFKSGQWHFHQDNTPVNNSILVTDYLTKMGIKRVPQLPYSPDLGPCDFWLFPKLRGCRYETSEEMKASVTLTRSHKRTSMGSSRSCWNGTTSALQLENTSKGTRVLCVDYQ